MAIFAPFGGTLLAKLRNTERSGLGIEMGIKIDGTEMAGAWVRDSVSGEHGKIEKVGHWSLQGPEAKIWLMESDSIVWRAIDAGEVERISAGEYDQACYEWELAHQDVVPTNNPVLRAKEGRAKRQIKFCRYCGGSDLQDGGADDTGRAITVCAACGERQEEV